MKFAPLICLSVFPVLILSHCAEKESPTSTSDPSNKSADQANPLISPSGIRAKFIPANTEEADCYTELWKDGKKLGTITNARPISFSPVDDILLLHEQAADDDLMPYLLNIGKGEYSMTGHRFEYVFGGRYLQRADWSADGSKLVIYSEADQTPREYKVSELLDREARRREIEEAFN